MFFIAPEKTKGPKPAKVIGTIEKYLIELAYQENEDLCNKHHAKKQIVWGIKGFTKGAGKGDGSSKNFKILMGIQ